MPGKRVASAVGVAFVFLGLSTATPAAATVTIGSADPLGPTLIPPNGGLVGCSTPPCAWSQATLPGRPVSSPVNGVIVRWRVQWGVTPDTIALRVLRPAAGGSLFVASTAPEPISTQKQTLTASVPISIGDRIAVEELGMTNTSPRGIPATGGVIDTWLDSPPNGGSAPPSVSGNPPDTELLLNADIEPSNDATLSRPRLNKKKGTARVTVTLPNAGALAISGGPVRPQTLSATQPGPVELALTPTKKAKKRLKRKGKSKGRVAFTFTPDFGAPSTEPLPLTLKRKLPRK
jgi:hypothetical protein